MRVKLCTTCPYVPRDLAGHYDPQAVLHVCAKCDCQQEASTNNYPRKTYRRQECATAFSIVGTAHLNVARSVRGNSAWCGTTPGKPPSVQRSAPADSGPVEKTTADSYLVSRPLDGDR